MDGGIFEQIVTILLAQGLNGVIIVTLGFAVYKLYNRNQELHETLRELGQETVKSNEAMTAALNRLTDSVRFRGITTE